jgi:hypothetical protein
MSLIERYSGTAYHHRLSHECRSAPSDAYDGNSYGTQNLLKLNGVEGAALVNREHTDLWNLFKEGRRAQLLTVAVILLIAGLYGRPPLFLQCSRTF